MVECGYERISGSGYVTSMVHVRLRRNPACWGAACPALVGMVFMLCGCAPVRSNGPPGQPEEQTLKPAQVAVTVSKETTYIVEPLRSDGYPDYATALNQRSSQGVTLENNSAVLFWKAVGPKEIFPQFREQYCQLLGISPLPEKGDYFVDFDDYSAIQKKNSNPPDAKPELETETHAWDMVNRAMKRPWSPQEFPVLAQWLAANEKPLEVIVEASKRPHRFDPLCCGPKISIMVVPLPAVETYGQIARALCCRATLRLHEGMLAEAWEDLLTCHRLARLVGQGPTVIDFLIATSRMEEVACMGDQVLLQHAQLTAPQAAKMREDLNRLPAMAKMSDKIDACERFTYLSAVMDCAAAFSQRGPASLVTADEASKLAAEMGLPDVDVSQSKTLDDTLKSLKRHSADTGIDWDLITREGNSWFDRIADAYRKPTRTEQREAMRKVEGNFRNLTNTAADAASLDELMLVNPRKAVSERLGQVLLTICSLPTDYIQSEDHWSMRFELDKLSFALASYHAEHGAYPAQLAELAPAYVTEVPKDIFDDSELHYQLEGEGYLLYSVGVNATDDGAKSYEEGKKGEGWDDLFVRVPAPEQE